MSQRAPALFVPHGGGPMPLLGDKSHSGLIQFLNGRARQILTPRPKAIVLVTAHWEQSTPTISSGRKHDLYYDYYGFPDAAYKVKYDAPGSPEVAKRVFNLLSNAGFAPKLDDKRGWDHGVFVPLKLLVPEANIPIVQLSVLSSQDPEQHIRMGKALESLRDEGIAIVGSGMSFHNMSAFRSFFSGRVSGALGKTFDDALTEACTSESQQERETKLINWTGLPGSSDSHPIGAAEHLMPLLVVAGAGGSAKGEKVLETTMMNAAISAFLW